MTSPTRTRVKICGLTREHDIKAAVTAGADAIGFVFYPHSKRAVTPAQAAALREAAPAFVSLVALFVNAEPDYVRAVIRQVKPDLLQFHGDETPAQCDAYGCRYVRAFRVGGAALDTPEKVLAAALAYPRAAAWLFDTDSRGYGGSGTSFDLALLDAVLASPQARPVILAGGLTAGSLGDALAGRCVYAVDVSSGVEDEPGIKSQAKMNDFMRAIRKADA